MAQQLSKADKIRKLLHLSNAVIAERIGCRVEYVRAVRQRTSEDGNPITPPTVANWNAAHPELCRKYSRITYRRIKESPERYAALRAQKTLWQRNRRAEARAS